MTESISTDSSQVISMDILAAILDAVPGKTVNIDRDLKKVWGRVIVTEEVDEQTLRITLEAPERGEEE